MTAPEPLERKPLVDGDGMVNHERLGEIERIAYAGELTYSGAGQMLRECTKAIKTLVIREAAARLAAPSDGLAEYAGYLADAAVHMADHIASLDVYCEDASNVRHFAAKVRAALATTGQPDG
jgi:hypothetical protein